MNTKTIAAATALFFALSGVAFASSVYTAPDGKQYEVPTGYVAYAYGVYYNSASALYFDPMTGQTSQIAPAGPATSNYNGLYTIPQGYSSSLYGTYYGGSNGAWYDPRFGFYSFNPPTGPVYLGQTTPPGNSYYTIAATVNPPLPNTGAGGEAGATIVVLALSALVAIGGIALLTKKQYA